MKKDFAVLTTCKIFIKTIYWAILIGVTVLLRTVFTILSVNLSEVDLLRPQNSIRVVWTGVFSDIPVEYLLCIDVIL